jgi:uncharacterized protein VirK/YbjX
MLSSEGKATPRFVQSTHVENRRVSLLSASFRNYSLGRAHRFRNSCKFFFRALLQPRLTRSWLDRLGEADMQPLWALRPRLAIKLQRPYGMNGFDDAGRCRALLDHYDALPSLIASGLQQRIYDEGLDVLEIVDPVSGRVLLLRLAYRNEFEMEGELSLLVIDKASGLMLVGLSFSLVRLGSLRCCLVGGVQASRDERMRGIIHDVAKEMHGLRPKAFGLWCLQQMLLLWGVDALFAVGDTQHIYRHWRKRKDIHASYDEFWQESEGTLQENGLWELPLSPRERSREFLKPSRRKQHERRYQMLGGIRASFASAISACLPGIEGAERWLPLVHVREDREAVVPAPAPKAAPVKDPSPGVATGLPVANHSF